MGRQWFNQHFINDHWTMKTGHQPKPFSRPMCSQHIVIWVQYILVEFDGEHLRYKLQTFGFLDTQFSDCGTGEAELVRNRFQNFTWTSWTEMVIWCIFAVDVHKKIDLSSAPHSIQCLSFSRWRLHEVWGRHLILDSNMILLVKISQ